MAEAAEPTLAGPVLGGTETLLLVEDEDAVRDLAREILTAHGYTVVEARHPGEALLIGERRSTGDRPAPHGYRDARDERAGAGREEGHIAWSDDVPHDPRFASPLFRAFPHQSGLIIPLVLDGQVMGTLYLVWWKERRQFDEPELAVLQAVGQQVGTLLRSARLHEATERQARQATKLYEIAGQLASTLDLDRALDRITETILDLLGCDASGVYGYDEARGGLVIRRGLHLDPELIRSLVLQPGEGTAGRAFAERRPVWTRDREADPALVRSTRPSNDENMMIVTGDQGLAAAYAVHILDVYDHYRFRAIETERRRKGKRCWSGFLDTNDGWQKGYVEGRKGALMRYFAR